MNEQFNAIGTTLFYNRNITEQDLDVHTVQQGKIWKKVTPLIYKCGNCGFIPVGPNVSELPVCYRCDSRKAFYETDHGLEPVKFTRFAKES